MAKNMAITILLKNASKHAVVIKIHICKEGDLVQDLS